MTASTATTGNTLTATVTRAMTTSKGDLVIFDAESDAWRPYSWQEVHAKAEGIAAAIGDRSDRELGAVGLVGEPTAEMVAAIQAAWLLGTSVSILPGPMRGASGGTWARQTLDRFADNGVTTVLSNGSHLDQLRSVDGPLRAQDLTGLGRGGGSTSFSAVTTGDSGTPAVLQGTAGSTGTPKTAVISRNALLQNTNGIFERLGADPSTLVGLSWLPLYHDMGLSFLMSGFLTGMPIWLAPNSAFAAAPFKWLTWLADSGATFTVAPNFAYDLLGKYASLIPAADLSVIQAAISGGEPIDCERFDRFLSETARFGFDPGAAVPAYGLAESTCAATMTGPSVGLRYDEVVAAGPEHGTAKVRKYALLGEPIPGMEVRIAPPRDEPAITIDREVGEIEIRGTSMMLGYLGQRRLEPGSWFKTGDLGYLVDGNLVVCGRAKELIIVAGRNIFPAEVERIVAEVEGVRSAGVAAIDTGADAPRPGLVIVAEYRGSDLPSARREVMSAVASECGVVPADVVFVEPGSLPRTTSGKLRRLEVGNGLESLAVRK